MLRGLARAATELGAHVAAHRDGVTDLALGVPLGEAAYEYATSRGARRAGRAAGVRGDQGKVVLAVIATYGDTRHTWWSGPATAARTCPATWPPSPSWRRPGQPFFTEIDHCVGNVELGRMDEWVEFYHRVIGFTNMKEFVGDDIATEYSALMSQVVADGSRSVKFPINEPVAGKKKSQIERVLAEFYGGPRQSSTSRWPARTWWPRCAPCAPRA